MKKNKKILFTFFYAVLMFGVSMFVGAILLQAAIILFYSYKYSYPIKLDMFDFLLPIKAGILGVFAAVLICIAFYWLNLRKNRNNFD